MMADANTTLRLLMVEDNAADARMVRQVLTSQGMDADLQWVTTGDEALAYLYRRVPYESADPPDLILLDLNLPGTSGWQVLESLKSTPELRGIPVVIFTGSEDQASVERAHAMHANAYVVKPEDLDRFVRVVTALVALWARAPRSIPIRQN